MRDPTRRAARLVRAYPRQWQERFGEELVELLAEDIARRPASWRRITDVGVNATMARLRAAGLAGTQALGAAESRSGLAAVFVGVSTCLLLGLAMLSQIAVGWRWEPPSGRAITVALVLMAASATAAAAVAIFAAIPILIAASRVVFRRGRGDIRRPLTLAAVGTLIVVVGAHRFERGWPGTGGHAWAHHALLPAGPASFAWAATLSITSYWAHPHALGAFPGTELAWMAVSPVAFVAAIAGAVKVVRRVELPVWTLGYEAGLASVAITVAASFLAGAACWVAGRDPSVHGGLYQVGTIDVVDLVVMAAALAIGWRGMRTARTAAPRCRGRFLR